MPSSSGGESMVKPLYKMPWSSQQCWTPVIKKLQAFDYETASQISFLNFIFRNKLLYLSVAWRSENENGMALECKRIQKPGRIFSGFSRILMELCGSQVHLAPSHGNFISGVANPEIVYCWVVVCSEEQYRGWLYDCFNWKVKTHIHHAWFTKVHVHVKNHTLVRPNAA